MRKELIKCQCKVFSHGGDFDTCDQIKDFDSFIANIVELDNKHQKIIEMCYHDSKVAVLHPNKDIELFGEWKEHNGIVFSNNYYLKSDKKLKKLKKKNTKNKKMINDIFDAMYNMFKL